MEIFKNNNYVYNGIVLDKYQTKVVKTKSSSSLVVAAAGSGKTFTICARIDYLVKEKKVSPKKILCLSFTNESVNDLKKSLLKNGLNIDVLTFHKFSLSILKDKYKICSSDLLSYIIDEYFYSFIYFGKLNKLLDFYLEEENINRDFFLTNFKKVIYSFINTFKSFGYDLQKFLNIIYYCRNTNDKILLLIIFDVYNLYEEEKKSECKIDFNDMLLEAKKVILEKKYFKYEYIIVDEYQDISYVRYDLIHSIVEKTSCNFMAVGDDYQSIYSFSGSYVSLFTKFKRYFKKSKIFKLKMTFRNPKDIVDISSRFVLQNKGQIKKRLKSFNYVKQSINIVYTDNPLETFKNICENIDNIMVLSRNKKDILEILDNEVSIDDKRLIYKNKDITYLTVHSAKGLESNYVIILNCIDDVLGFPNKIREDELIKYLKRDSDNIDEERRLFYVALTRCKKKVFIFTVKNKESIYIKELLRKYKYKINIMNLDNKKY